MKPGFLQYSYCRFSADLSWEWFADLRGEKVVRCRHSRSLVGISARGRPGRDYECSPRRLGPRPAGLAACRAHLHYYRSVSDVVLKSFQPVIRIEQLQHEGILVGDWSRVAPGTERAYGRMVEVMTERGIDCRGKPPVWAWQATGLGLARQRSSLGRRHVARP